MAGRQHRFRVTQFPPLYAGQRDVFIVIAQAGFPVQPPAPSQQSHSFQVAGVKTRAGDRQATGQGEVRFRQQDFLPGGHIHRIAEQPADSLTHGHPDKLPADKLSGTFSAKFRPQLCRLPPRPGQPAEQTRHDKQYIHHLAQPVRNFRTDFQYRLCAAAEKHIRRTVFNHRVAFGVVILTGGGLAVDVDIFRPLGDAFFCDMVIAFHRTQYRARRRATVGADILRTGEDFSCRVVDGAPDGLAQLQYPGGYLIGHKTQNQPGKKTAAKEGKGGKRDNGDADDSADKKPGERAGVVDRIIHTGCFIHGHTSV
ncbi:Uncharacterised protein [Salmonella enterica subsp. enterica serovar Typhimurium str. DT104]|nr:Uncharacterised protein [Salmonella enterica subsp. enterica serovar Typhimurium str. DT104]CQB26449.1 Uncharacterised protein [Salmonella enterica subsp. enterica serovar Typhimurium str. DT104]CQC30038.1 Uncharacterised protein [Salmonella enterica subsp. enterica serovar Typhimurium str. DT104]CQC84817.1 Uncharacterised protein [Salmonella enterica subsp. enterica serovar Typhimurium str. DT104]CQF09662.1 Uncharacterised protein [Salmonella enterica subsp. enterica serovar Typhimurium str